MDSLRIGAGGRPHIDLDPCFRRHHVGARPAADDTDIGRCADVVIGHRLHRQYLMRHLFNRVDAPRVIGARMRRPSLGRDDKLTGAFALRLISAILRRLGDEYHVMRQRLRLDLSAGVTAAGLFVRVEHV